MDTPTKKGLKWSAEADRDLYAACLVAIGEPKGNTLRQAVQILEDSLGVVVSVKAASHRVQHLQKLKRKEGAGSTNAGPAKKKGAAPRGTKRPAKAAVDDDEDEDMEDTPSKKRSKGKSVAAPVIDKDNMKPVKHEPYDENSDDDAV